jgi:hypothetical protein
MNVAGRATIRDTPPPPTQSIISQVQYTLSSVHKTLIPPLGGINNDRKLEGIAYYSESQSSAPILQ